MTEDHHVLVAHRRDRQLFVLDYISKSKQRGIDGVASQIRAWLAGTTWRRQERA